nr:hypothetical protein L204_00698 [Cryptococcus depauperatus CBS 7855]
MDPYTPEYDRPPYVEEVIQPGYDTEYDTGPGYEYTEAYPPPQYALEDELGDINIQDDWIDPQDDFDQEYIEESWIPYSSPIPPKYSSATPASQNGNQQVVIAPPTNWYPPPSDLRQHYCELYPGDCLQNRTPLETNATERSNTTLGEDLTSRTNLKHIDLPGVGLALVLLLFILFGLNAGWSSGGNDKKDRRSSTANPSETGSGSGSGGKGNETGSGGRSSGTGSGGRSSGTGSGGRSGGSGGRGDGRPPSEKDKKNDGESKSWLSPPILLGLLLLIPLLAMAGRSSLPQIGSHSMPTLKRPSIFTGGLEGMRGPGGLGAILTDPVTDAAPRAAISPRARAAVGSKWVVNSKPEPKAHIHINNVNSQGDGNPINIGSSTNERPVEITVEEPVEEKVWEPVTFNFTGPSNPDRLLKMILAALVVALPLVIDWVTDYPKRQYSQPEYLEPMVQFLVLGALFLICLLVADWHFGLSSAVYTIAPYAEVSLTEARSGLTPLIVGAVETGESLLWSVEDVVFGDSRVLLGMGLAALGVVLASQKEPSLEVPKTDYASGATQAIYFFGALLIGMFVWST